MAPTPKIPITKIKAIAIYLLKIIVLAVVYHLAARLGLKMPYVQVNTSPGWPLIPFPFRFWPAFAKSGAMMGRNLTSPASAAEVKLELIGRITAKIPFNSPSWRKFSQFHTFPRVSALIRFPST